MIMTIIWSVVIFCLLIFVHELGHFLAAKAVGIRVNEFAVGMGPLLLHFQKGETEYSLRAFPIGGYTKMEGEDENSDDARAFNNKSTLAKAFVVIAGAFMNLVTTIILLTAVVLIIGTPTNVVKDLSPDLPAVQAGLQSGDKIVRIDGAEISTWEDITDTISKSKGETIALEVERDGQNVALTSGISVDETGRRIIGITPTYGKNPAEAIKYGFTGTYDMGKSMIDYLGVLITGGGSTKDLVGPVGIVSLIGDYAKMGIAYLLNLTALISLNLAIINLLPLPALDGGRLLFLVIRKVTGKAITDEMEGRVHFVGMMLLFGLMIYILVQDVNRFIIN